MLLSLLFILTVQNVQTQHAYPWESAIWKKIVCQARQHITAQCFTAQVGIPHHDASDTLGLISSKRLHPRVRQNKFWSVQLHVQVHCEIAWALTVRMPSFILNFRRGFYFLHFCVRSVTPCPNYTDWSLLFLEHWTSQVLSPSLLCGLSVVELDAYFFIPNPIYITS